MTRVSVFRRVATLLALSAVTLGTGVASAASKPAHYLIPAGATVLHFTGSISSSSGAVTGTGSETVTNVAIINEIRGLINALPVSDTRDRFCPADLMIPSYVSFLLNAGTAPYARVEFQLGGCPFARVFDHGAARTPALGGPHLGVVYAKIKSLIAAND